MGAKGGKVMGYTRYLIIPFYAVNVVLGFKEWFDRFKPFTVHRFSLTIFTKTYFVFA
jgi:hypothetical protein